MNSIGFYFIKINPAVAEILRSQKELVIPAGKPGQTDFFYEFNTYMVKIIRTNNLW